MRSDDSDEEDVDIDKLKEEMMDLEDKVAELTDFKEQAEETLEDICGSIDNIDIAPFIPNLVDAIADPETVPDCPHRHRSSRR